MSSITKPSQKAREFIKAAPDAKPATPKGRKTSQQMPSQESSMMHAGRVASEALPISDGFHIGFDGV